MGLVESAWKRSGTVEGLKKSGDWMNRFMLFEGWMNEQPKNNKIWMMCKRLDHYLNDKYSAHLSEEAKVIKRDGGK